MGNFYFKYFIVGIWRKLSFVNSNFNRRCMIEKDDRIFICWMGVKFGKVEE